MAWPSPKRFLFCFCCLIWIGIQGLFFIPPRGGAFILLSPRGNFHLFQKGSQAVLIGAYSDRYQRFPKMELIPFLRRKGITRIQKLILTGPDTAETGALEILQNHIRIIELDYPPDTALRMRKTFGKSNSDMAMKKISADQSAIEEIKKEALRSLNSP